MTETETLRSRLSRKPIVVAPGVYDPFTALIASRAGFTALYVSGAAIAYTKLGRPDIGLVTMTEVTDTLALIRDRVGSHLIVDADTGYGNALNVVRTVREFERAGATAIQLEDQDFPKRCGHLDGKALIPVAEMCGKIRAAVDTRRSHETLIVARTDAVAVEGFERAIERAVVYREAGADVLFVEAPRDRAEIERIARELPGPLLLNIVKGGRTPMLPADELGALGYSLVLYANAAMRGAQLVLASLREHGETRQVLDAMIGWSERQTLVNKPAYDSLERRYREGPAHVPDPGSTGRPRYPSGNPPR
jgi:2-methylisocitrate lyase-like PEP mutase family enzyme